MGLRDPVLLIPGEREFQIAQRLEQLAGLTVREQLERVGILSICRKELLYASAYLIPEEGGFSIVLDIRRKVHWPADLGHEMGHTFFFKWDSWGRPSENLYSFSGPDHPIEEFCDWFRFRWLLSQNNYAEALALSRELSSSQTGILYL